VTNFRRGALEEDMAKRQRGLTLIEVVIASLVFSVIVLVTLGLWVTAGDASDTATRDADLHQRGRLLLDELTRTLAQAKILNVSTTPGSLTLNASVLFQLPVDWDGDGDAVNAAGAIEWGAPNPSGAGATLGWRLQLLAWPDRFLTEAVDGIDYNRDGDKVDSFVSCRVELRTLDAAGVLQATRVLDREVVLNDTPRNGDIDNRDGPDPLFVLRDGSGAEVPSNGVRLAISAWHGRLGRSRDFHLRNTKTEITLRNPQSP